MPSAATGAATTAAAGGSAAAAGGAAAGGLLSISVVANEAVNVIVGGIGSPSGAGAVITGVAKAAGKTIVQAASPVTEAGASLLADVAGLAADTPLAAFVKEVAATTQAAAGERPDECTYFAVVVHSSRCQAFSWRRRRMKAVCED